MWRCVGPLAWAWLMFEWVPISVLPNVFVQDAIEADYVALVSYGDKRLSKLCSRYDRLRVFLSKFTDAFGVQIRPSVILLREDAPDRFRTIDAIASFRDLVSVAALARSHSLDLVYGAKGRTGRVRYSNYFSLYPWMLDKNYDNIIAHTPALWALHHVEEFVGQSSPEVPEVTISTSDLDEPLLQELASRWCNRYAARQPTWSDQALFRSLNTANHAARLPAGIDTTFYDVGRQIALWVSAFEILAHPGTGQSGVLRVYELLENVCWLDKDIKQRRFKTNNGRLKSPPRRNLACWIYSQIYDVRNAFLHGNPVSQRHLMLGSSGHHLFSLVLPLYRMALSGFLGLKWAKPIPPVENPEAFGAYVSDRWDFNSYQDMVERALQRARQPTGSRT